MYSVCLSLFNLLILGVCHAEGDKGVGLVECAGRKLGNGRFSRVFYCHELVVELRGSGGTDGVDDGG